MCHTTHCAGDQVIELVMGGGYTCSRKLVQCWLGLTRKTVGLMDLCTVNWLLIRSEVLLLMLECNNLVSDIRVAIHIAA